VCSSFCKGTIFNSVTLSQPPDNLLNRPSLTVVETKLSTNLEKHWEGLLILHMIISCATQMVTSFWKNAKPRIPKTNCNSCNGRNK
jgi:hypothetical protein